MAGTSDRYFAALDELVDTSRVVIDRPAGTAHPRVPQAIYPLDYGYLDGTTGGDGDGIDVFVGVEEGLGVVGVLLTADVAKRDVEVKVLLDCSALEIVAARAFVSEVLEIGGVLVRRPPEREQAG
ncbi:inorganic pyrophosphatase [Tsukamurella paurometabola]|uniref:Inorganic pyrophosphatase n=2 Tax=Tsukamurella paurometabola TaxID=2061 RepID=A0ABS5NLC7_TSUPA|nr:inorganic pyrophosphatase [Tsukamurella paurometabola]